MLIESINKIEVPCKWAYLDIHTHDTWTYTHTIPGHIHIIRSNCGGVCVTLLYFTALLHGVFNVLHGCDVNQVRQLEQTAHASLEMLKLTLKRQQAAMQKLKEEYGIEKQR